jgi:mono/diheme cytochrome c family protein
MASSSKLAGVYETHSASFPIPFPLTETELADLGIESDPGDGTALERGVERGEHLVKARYACRDCHGQNFAGGVMVDAFPVGRLLGPNVTRGEGSKSAAYTAADWDRIVRHGVKPDGTPATMPSVEFQLMSDQELSDIVAYIRSLPPMYAEVPAPTLGPLGKVLVAAGQLPLSAEMIPSHQAPHVTYPPAATVSVEFGRHLSGVCMGCHGESLAGGPRPELGAGREPDAARGRPRRVDVRAVPHRHDGGRAAGRHRAVAADDVHPPGRAEHDRRRNGGAVGVPPVDARGAGAQLTQPPG